MRFLLVNNHCISDPTAGVTQSLRTIMAWLANAGHACHILTTARFESPVTFTIEEHLRQRGVPLSHLLRTGGVAKKADKRLRRAARRPVVHYTVGDVPVTMLLTRHNDEAQVRSCRGRAVRRAGPAPPRRICSRPVDRLQCAPDDPSCTVTGSQAQNHHRVCCAGVRLLRATSTSSTWITCSRAADS